MDPHSEQELLTALSNKDAGKYEALIQQAPVINNELLANIMFATGVDGLRAVLKHSSINPFYNDNELIHLIIKHNVRTEYLGAILEHPMNQLTADHYRAFISSCNNSRTKRGLLESYLNKL